MRALLRITAIFFAGLLALAPAMASAQNWPTKPIRIINPFPAGGGTDTFARPLAAKLTQALGQTVYVENQGGAGGTLGATNASRAAPDGYTFFMGAIHHTIAESVYAKLPYNIERDFIPITVVAYVPQVMVVHPKHPFKTIKELVDYAKANPGKLNYGSAGQGGLAHLATELFKLTAGVDMVHIPYKGTGPAITDLIGGRLQLMFGNIVPILPHVKTGRLRGIAVTTAKRISALPDVPTVAESGMPGYEAVVWFGVWAPPRISRAIVDRLNQEIRRVVVLPEIKDRLAIEGLDAAPSTPAEFTAYLKKDIEKWTRVVKAAGVKPE